MSLSDGFALTRGYFAWKVVHTQAQLPFRTVEVCAVWMFDWEPLSPKQERQAAWMHIWSTGECPSNSHVLKNHLHPGFSRKSLSMAQNNLLMEKIIYSLLRVDL